MKKKMFYTLVVFLMVFSTPSFAQLTKPGDGTGGSPVGGDHDPVGGGAPIGSGLALVLGLGLAYGAKKTYQLKEEE